METKKQNQVEKKTNKGKKTLSFDQIISNVNLCKDDKSGYVSLINSFCALKDIKTPLKSEEIEEFFNAVIEKIKDETWKFLLDCFVKIYKKKIKNYNVIIRVVKEKAYILAHALFNERDIVSSIKLLQDANGISEYKKWFSKLLKESNNKEMLISLVIVVSVLEIEKYVGVECENIICLLLRVLSEEVGGVDKQDYLYLKQISKSLKESKYSELFGSFAFLYRGTSEEILELNSELNDRKIYIQEKNNQIDCLEKELGNSKNSIKELESTIQTMRNELEKCNNNLIATNNRNDFEKNKYEQQFLSLKKSFVDKIKKDISLEIEGLEDIADGLDDVVRNKVQRRIDNIYKILQKDGE